MSCQTVYRPLDELPPRYAPGGSRSPLSVPGPRRNANTTAHRRSSGERPTFGRPPYRSAGRQLAPPAQGSGDPLVSLAGTAAIATASSATPNNTWIGVSQSRHVVCLSLSSINRSPWHSVPTSVIARHHVQVISPARENCISLFRIGIPDLARRHPALFRAARRCEREDKRAGAGLCLPQDRMIPGRIDLGSESCPD